MRDDSRAGSRDGLDTGTFNGLRGDIWDGITAGFQLLGWHDKVARKTPSYFFIGGTITLRDDNNVGADVGPLCWRLC